MSGVPRDPVQPNDWPEGLGDDHFHSGRARDAIPHFKEGLRRAAARNHHAAALRCSESLYEVYRYLGDGARAAAYGEQAAALLDVQGAASEARRYRSRAAVARAGEPPLRVVFNLHKETWERDEVRPLLGPLPKHYWMADVAIPVLERNRIELRAAQHHHENATPLIHAGRCDAALAEFRRAAAIDPFDPTIPRSVAFVHMALGRYDEAAAAYDAADALAPGWETSHSGSCRADAWMCRHLARRRWRSEVLHALLLLCQESPQFIKDATKLAEVQKVLPEAPDCARLHLARAHALPGASRARDDAAVVAAYRAGLAACEADDVPPWGQDYVTRSWLLKGLSHYCADPAERLRLLREAASLDDRGSVIAAAGAWIELRKLGEEV